VAIECIAERITINPNEPYVITVSAVMLESSKMPADYYIIDTMDANNPDWDDSMTAYGTDADKIDNM
jgi:hypothetical protein